MSPPELRRLATMQHPRARAEFLTGRWLIRGILGRLLGMEPTAVRLLETEAGSLSVEGEPFVFNLSHTDGLVALATSAHGELGVDVEWSARRGRTVELAERYFAAPEIEALRALPEEAQRPRFFQLWTLKEAYIKARGLGLRIPLHSFAFDLTGGAPTVKTQQESADRGHGWIFFEGPIAPDRHLALAWRPPTHQQATPSAEDAPQ